MTLNDSKDHSEIIGFRIHANCPLLVFPFLPFFHVPAVWQSSHMRYSTARLIYKYYGFIGGVHSIHGFKKLAINSDLHAGAFLQLHRIKLFFQLFVFTTTMQVDKMGFFFSGNSFLHDSTSLHLIAFFVFFTPSTKTYNIYCSCHWTHASSVTGSDRFAASVSCAENIVRRCASDFRLRSYCGHSRHTRHRAASSLY